MGEVNAVGGVTEAGGRYEEKYEEVHGVRHGKTGLSKRIWSNCDLRCDHYY